MKPHSHNAEPHKTFPKPSLIIMVRRAISQEVPVKSKVMRNVPDSYHQFHMTWNRKNGVKTKRLSGDPNSGDADVPDTARSRSVGFDQHKAINY